MRSGRTRVPPPAGQLSPAWRAFLKLLDCLEEQALHLVKVSLSACFLGKRFNNPALRLVRVGGCSHLPCKHSLIRLLSVVPPTAGAWTTACLCCRRRQ